MASRHAAKIIVGKVALEIIQAGRTPGLVPEHNAMTREALLEAVTNIVQKDRLDLTDDQFRHKYVNYIRKYWAGKPLMILKRGAFP